MTNHAHPDHQEGASVPASENRSALPEHCLRSHRRFRWRGTMEVAWQIDDGFDQPQLIDSLDLGLGGMGLVSSIERPKGSIAAALLLDAGESGALKFFEVVHCRLDESIEGYLIGSRWIERPAGANLVCVRNSAKGLRLSVQSDQSEQTQRAADAA